MEEDPRLVAAGKRGAVKRWGPARRLCIGDLLSAQRCLVLAAIEAEREKAQRTESTPA